MVYYLQHYPISYHIVVLLLLIKKKNWSATKCILLLLVIGIVGCVFGVVELPAITQHLFSSLARIGYYNI